jgi:hypothetical protein
MQVGLSLSQLAAKLDAQAAAKKDFIAPTKRTRMEVSQQGPLLVLEDQGQFPITPLANRQIGTFCDIPAKYYDRMLSDAPALLKANVDEWFQRSDKSRMVRTLDNKARAYLSNSFARIDNLDIAKVALPVLHDMSDVKIVSSEVTDSKLYLQFVFERMKADVKVGDTVMAGGLLTNSEVGLGAYAVSGLVWRLRCLNGLKTADAFRKAHVGKAVDDTEALWQEDTIAADEKVVLLKLRDMLKAIADESRFQIHVDKLKGLTDGTTKNPVKTIEVLSQKLGLSETERNATLTSLIEGGDLSRFGILQALTAQAHTAPTYDRAIEFEALGGQLLELGRDEWREVLAEAA